MELEEAANAAQAQADHEAETLAALENAARDSPFPLSKYQWTAHVYPGLCPAFNYFMERVAEGPDGGYSVHSESSIHHMPKLSLVRMLLH